jgi:2-haloacid dehalogenase
VARFDLVAFDLYGTLLDVSGLGARIEEVAGCEAASLLPRWRRTQLERSWRIVRGSAYEPWDAVTLAALEEVAPEMPRETRDRLAELWRTVPAFPDAEATLEALKAAGLSRVVLSNGTRAMVRSALDAAGLEVDRVLSADDVGVYKTDPRVYALLDALADRDRTLFVSSNGWDVDGAQRTGRIVAWIDRGSEPPAVGPSYRVAALSEIVGLARGALGG